MTDDQTKSRSSLAVWLMVAASLLVAYVLSLGPAAWLTSNGYFSAKAHKATYWPIYVVCDFCGPLDGALGYYERLWLRLPMRDSGPRPEIQGDGSLPQLVEP